MSAVLPRPASRALAVALLAAVLATAYFGAAMPAVDTYAEYKDSVRELRDRILRYRRALREKPLVEKRLAAVSGDKSVGKYLLPGAGTALAAANLQKKLKQIVAKSGGRFISAQTLKGDVAGRFEEVKVGLKLEADVAALKTILYAVESDTIILLVDKLSLRSKDSPGRGKLGERKAVLLKVDMQVKGYRRRKAT